MSTTLMRRDRRYAAGVWIGALVFFGLLAPYGLNIGEEGATVYLIARVAAGQRPYLDFISGYTPAYFYWHAALLRALGSNLLVLRASVALANSLAIALLFIVSRQLLPRRWALLAALVYPAVLPIVASLSCSFNVPYPAWYAVLFWLLTVLLLQRWYVDARARWLLLAGGVAALSFAFKPNSGLFNLAAVMLTVTAIEMPGRAPVAAASHWAVRLLAAASTLVGVAIVLRTHLMGREGAIFALPVGLLPAVLLWRARRRAGSGASPAEIAAVLIGFALPTLPWLLWYWNQLGSQRFAHDVLFLGTGYEQFFYLPYRAFGADDVLLVIAAALLVALPTLCVAGRLRPAQMFAVCGVIGLAAAAFLALAPMPEGFQHAVLQRVQHMSFAVVALIHAALIVALWRQRERRAASSSFNPPGGRIKPSPFLRRDRRDHRAFHRAQLTIFGLAAVCCFLDAYPRSDFFHLSYSTPFTWVVAVWLVWRVVRLWQRAVPWAAIAIDRGSRAVVTALLLVLAWPALEVAGTVAHYVVRPERSSLMRLDLHRAGVLVRRDVAPSVRDLVAVVAYLDSAPTAERWLFTFPNLDLIAFLAARNNPARIGYFNPGWPDHLVEAAVVDALQARPPELAVVADPASLFFADAPAYYILLRDLMQRRYATVGRIGAYTILRRSDFTAPAFGPSPSPPAADCSAPRLMEDPEHLEGCLRRDGIDRRALLLRVRDSESPAAAAVLARWWLQRGAAMPPSGVTGAGVLPLAGGRDAALPRLALRVVGELGDARAAAALLQVTDPVAPAQRDAWATALFFIAVRGLIDPFQFGRSEQERDINFDDVDTSRLLVWLDDPAADLRLRFVAAWILGERAAREQAQPDAVLLSLRRAAADPALRLAAAPALLRVTNETAAAQQLLDSPAGPGSLPTALFVEWCRSHAEAVLALLQPALGGNGESRELVVLTAGLLRREELVPLLAEALASGGPRLRAAALWSLGEIGSPVALPLVRAAEADVDPLVRDFARAARRQLEHRDGSG